jgi:ABC-type transport system involved in multi-copper enzyme maturation permease subunit
MTAILAIAKTTLNEAIRRRVLLIILFVGALLISIIPSLGVLSARSDVTTTRAMMFAVLRMTSIAIAIILTVYMIPNEIERRTIYTILCKPVQRHQFLLGKYLGALYALGMMMLLMTLLMMIMYKIFKNPDPTEFINIARQSFFYFIEAGMLTALCIMFSTFTPPLVNFFLSGGFWVVGSVLAPLYESIKDNSGTNPVMKTIARVVTDGLPNFAQYDVKNSLINNNQVIQDENRYFFYIGVYGVVYIIILLAAGIYLFDKREV